MSDTVLIALIAGAPGVLASILGFINNILVRRQGKTSEGHLIETKTAVQETKTAMEHLEKNTNSITDALVKVTAESSRAIGRLEGHAEAKAETREAEKKP